MVKGNKKVWLTLAAALAAVVHVLASAGVLPPWLDPIAVGVQVALPPVVQAPAA